MIDTDFLGIILMCALKSYNDYFLIDILELNVIFTFVLYMKYFLHI